MILLHHQKLMENIVMYYLMVIITQHVKKKPNGNLEVQTRILSLLIVSLLTTKGFSIFMMVLLAFLMGYIEGHLLVMQLVSIVTVMTM